MCASVRSVRIGRNEAVLPDVVGIDADPAILDCARDAAPSATLIHRDFLTYPFANESFDLVAAIASLHHMDFRLAVRRINELLRPGGVAAVIGIEIPAATFRRRLFFRYSLIWTKPPRL